MDRIDADPERPLLRLHQPDQRHEYGRTAILTPPKSIENIFYTTRDGFKARQAQMPREAVCTENLTPFLKLLPCGRHAGLASLINPPHVLDNRFHSLNVSIEQLCLDKGCSRKQVRLTQTLSVVHNWAKWHEGDLSWNLKDILGGDKFGEHCTSLACKDRMSRWSSQVTGMTTCWWRNRASKLHTGNSLITSTMDRSTALPVQLFV